MPAPVKPVLPNTVATITVDGLGILSFRPEPESPFGRRWEVAFLRERFHDLTLAVNGVVWGLDIETGVKARIPNSYRIVIRSADANDHISTQFPDGVFTGDGTPEGENHKLDRAFTLADATSGTPSVPSEPEKLTFAYIYDAVFYVRTLVDIAAKHSLKEDPNDPATAPAIVGQAAGVFGGDIVCPGVGIIVELRDENNDVQWSRELPALPEGASPHTISLINAEVKEWVANDFEFYAKTFNVEQTHEFWSYCPDSESTGRCGCGTCPTKTAYQLFEQLNGFFAAKNFKTES